ncbi:1,4-alpha-glucan branching protein [Streptomyces sp. NBC_01408]|uniref:maltokinase N-terminal cap-like domain-containing protein n=1 Tax=Streptomyces sp. NBC_01408 TaxID=2903855 RepID=UPI002252F5CF|nr:1,4-alpha-glucan branching protein [Streptomyces sp. NBC_01408]MCX4695949.1 1,4-alpha-glucan branching protein [Streptomyces sp. NBC_01408]
MAVIHRTTMFPGKLELLSGWLPSRPWYRGGEGSVPLLAKAGGFRLDDPEGEVGVEFMVVTDDSGDAPVAYLVPLTYRGAPLKGAEEGLIGTSEHGVLGRRWIYDGVHDLVLVEQLLALLAGRTTAQDQDASDAPDPTVEVRTEGEGVAVGLTGPGRVADTAGATVVAVGRGFEEGPVLHLTVSRVLRPEPAAGDDVRGQLLAGWSAPDGTGERGVFAFLSGSGR